MNDINTSITTNMIKSPIKTLFNIVFVGLLGMFTGFILLLANWNAPEFIFVMIYTQTIIIALVTYRILDFIELFNKQQE